MLICFKKTKTLILVLIRTIYENFQIFISANQSSLKATDLVCTSSQNEQFAIQNVTLIMEFYITNYL